MNVACKMISYLLCYRNTEPGLQMLLRDDIGVRIFRRWRRIDRISLYFNVIPTVFSLARRYPAAPAGLTDYTHVHLHPGVCEKSSFGLIFFPFLRIIFADYVLQ